jgi:CheY-like chemotaxis protein
LPLILIVDDEPLQRMLIRESLANDGSLTFSEAENGRQALKTAHAVKPDVVIVDVSMPQMDGFQVCRLFKDDQNLRAVQIILITARWNAEDLTRWQAAGACTLIRKPFEVADLQTAVRNALIRASQQLGVA